MCIYYIYMYIDAVNHTERPSLLLSLLMCSSLSTSQFVDAIEMHGKETFQLDRQELRHRTTKP